MAYETIEVTPLSPIIGAEISGVDISKPLGNQTFQEGRQIAFGVLPLPCRS